MFKVKMIILLVCIVAGFWGNMKVQSLISYDIGFERGRAFSDDEAFNAYTDFAKKMKHETHHAKARTDDTVWAALNNKQ